MTRLLFGCLFALSITFVSGCGGGSTETTVIEDTAQSTEEEDAAYEAEMEAEEEGEDGAEGDG